MCRMKSGLIFKDEVFIPDYDSHSQMLEELGIEDNEKNASSKFIRAELYPKDNDVFSPIDTWVFRVDQDILPDWYVEKYDEERMRSAVKKWAEEHIHVGKDNLKISSGENHYIKDCKNVRLYGSATVKYIYGSATVENIYGSATVENIYGSATVKNICDSATVEYIYGSATVKNICDSATVEYIYGSATVKNIYGSATVKNIYGSATVEYIYGSATVKYICDSATVKKAAGLSTIISSPYGWNKKESLVISENATFKDCETKTIWQSGRWTLNAAKVEGKQC